MFSVRHIAAIVAGLAFHGEAVVAQTASPLSPAPVSGGTLERALAPVAPTASTAKPRPHLRTFLRPRPWPRRREPTQPQRALRRQPPQRPSPLNQAKACRAIARTCASERSDAALQPETFFATAKASERYAAIADGGGWPVIAAPLSQGAKGAPVEILRQRLAIEGDLSPTAATGEVWTPELTDAVKRFQFRVGLRPTGAVTARH